MNDPSLVEKVAEALGPHAWTGDFTSQGQARRIIGAINAAGYVVVQGPVTKETHGPFWRADESGNPAQMRRTIWLGPWLPVEGATP